MSWWWLRGAIYRREWEEGPLIFLGLLALIALLGVVPLLASRLRAPLPRWATNPRWLAVPLFGAGLGLLWRELRVFGDSIREPTMPLVDIGGNTWAAAVRFTSLLDNPYTTRCQLISVVGDPGVTEVSGQLEMFGVPYFNGYPYFPAMFLSYAPFRLIDEGPDSIRYGNVAVLLLMALTTGWLAARLTGGRLALVAAGMAVLLLSLSTGLGRQLFGLGSTDAVIGVFLLLALIALTYRLPAVAGALMGVAFACKLIPGLVAGALFFAWALREPGFRRVVVGFAAAVGVLLVPFLIWHPGGFLSATVLFYMTHHADGDPTSMWFHLPPALQTPFLVGGAVILLGIVTSPLWGERRDVTSLTRLVAVACFVFIASNKMIHVNYDFAILPLATTVLAVDAVSVLGAGARGRRESF